jgi:hypothetical protein
MENALRFLGRLLYVVVLLHLAQPSQAQTGIGTASPNASAALDVQSASRGMLVPRVALQAVADGTTISNPATSLLVYNTNPAMGGGVGFYFNAGLPAVPSWQRFVTTDSNVGLEFWGMGGNGGTTAAHFMGTTDSHDLAFRVGNTERMRLYQTGGLMLGNSSTNNMMLGIGAALAPLSGAASANTFVGSQAGKNSTTGSNNTFFGFNAGLANTSGSNNTYLGAGANAGGGSAATLTNATAIGANAVVSQSNAIVLGNGVRVGIGSSTPSATLHVAGGSSSVRLEGLGGSGTRMLVTDNSGNLTSQPLPGSGGSGGSFINNQSFSSQNADFRISGDGLFTGFNSRVGIGTSNPQTELHVNGQMVLTDGVIQNSSNNIINGTNDLGLYSQTDGDPIRFVTNDASIRFYSDGGDNDGGNDVNMMITADGNLGIGTGNSSNSVAARLHVGGNGTVRVNSLGGGGTRLLTTNNSGTIVAGQVLSGAGNDFINNNQTITAQTSSGFNVNGTGRVGTTLTVGTNLTVGGTTSISGATTLSNLAGTGTRMAVASNTGVLSTQALPQLSLSGTTLSLNGLNPVTLPTNTGPQGPAGPTGATGATGPTGPQGPTGADGATGPAGPQGIIGATGPAGADGATGPQGPSGATGSQGPAGPAGADGATGPQGPAGANGAIGPQGPAGPAGANGNDGAPGATGPAGPAGSNATAAAANGLSGTVAGSVTTIALGGTLAQATTVAQAGYTMAFTGGNIGLGAVSPSSTAEVDGTLAFTPQMNLPGGGALSNNAFIGLNPGASNTYTLPAASSAPGRLYLLRNYSSTNDATLNTGGGSLISPGGSSPSFTMPAVGSGKMVQVISDGSDWLVVILQ